MAGLPKLFLHDSSFDENSDDYFNPYHNDKCEKKGLGLCCKENRYI